jgi:type IV pilus assembly protein PilF
MREFFIVLFSLSLVACVTTKTSTFTKNISLEKEVEARVQVGLSYLQQGNPEMAIYHMREVVEKQPDSPRVHEVLALALWETGENDRADKHFLKMVKYDPGYSRGRLNYATFLVSQNKYKASKKALLVVTDDIYFPNRGKAFYMLASVHKMLGENDEMVAAYERSIRLDRRNLPALIELSEYRYQEGQFAQSYTLHKQYRESVRQSSAKALLLGIKLAIKFDDKGEEASFALALKNLYPRSNEYLEYLQLSKSSS